MLPGERIDRLGYHGLRIIQNPEKFKFTIDAFLLTGFINSGPKDCLLDLGTGAGVLALPGWVGVAPAHWPLVAGLAVAGFLGQAAITEAFRHGQAAVVAPFEYTALAWGVGLDWLLWHSLPDGATLAGGAIIIASGIYLVRSERRHG